MKIKNQTGREGIRRSRWIRAGKENEHPASNHPSPGLVIGIGLSSKEGGTLQHLPIRGALPLSPAPLLSPDGWARMDHGFVQGIKTSLPQITGKIEMGQSHVSLALPPRAEIARSGHTSESARLIIERMVHRRTTELERSNRDLEEFAYVISHDLQEPLRMVASFLHLIEIKHSNSIEPETAEFIGYAIKGANRMRMMILDLLEFSRIGKGEDEMTILSLDVPLDFALTSLALALSENGVEIKRPPTLPQVMGNAMHLGRLFQNLIGNAIKYRHPDRIAQIGISVQAAGDLWQVSITDNGVGIDPEFFDIIFRVFQRIDRYSETSGAGIGLSISRKIVELHGGTIWVESIPGKGSSFNFTLKSVGC